MSSRVILTMAATAVATVGGPASAGPAAAATARPAGAIRPVIRPITRPATPVPPIPAATGLLGLEGMDVASNWCLTPKLATPLGADLVPAAQACDRKPPADNGVHVLDGVCLAPVSWDGSDAARDAACQGPKDTGPLSVLRDFSVAGVQVTR